MGGRNKYKWFFRFRSTIQLAKVDQQITPWTIFSAIQYIDINREGLLREYVRICQVLPSAFSIRDLYELTWTEYEIIVMILKEDHKTDGGT